MSYQSRNLVILLIPENAVLDLFYFGLSGLPQSAALVVRWIAEQSGGQFCMQKLQGGWLFGPWPD